MTSDPVNHPEHYTQGDIEIIDCIKAVLAGYTDHPFAAYCIGNVVKYAARAPYKGSMLQDLEKAEKYLEWATFAVWESENSSTSDESPHRGGYKADEKTKPAAPNLMEVEWKFLEWISSQPGINVSISSYRYSVGLRLSGLGLITSLRTIDGYFFRITDAGRQALREQQRGTGE